MSIEIFSDQTSADTFIAANAPNFVHYDIGSIIVYTGADIPVVAVTTAPDGDGFLIALKTAMGSVVAANVLAVAYPLFFTAISLQEWSDVLALIVDAHSKGVLSAVQYADFGAAVAAFNIPIILP